MILAVVIPTYNRKDLVLNLIKQFNEQKKVDDITIRIIVVVDGSTDGTIEAIKAFSNDIIVVEGNGHWWYTKSLNEGCRMAVQLKSDFILTMNDDCSISNGLVGQLYQDYLKVGKPGAIGAITLIKSNPFRVTFSGAQSFNRLKMKFVPYIDNRIEVEPEKLSGIFPTYSLMTRGLFFPTEVGESIDFFDEKNFPQYGSDEDFGLRLINRGYTVSVSRDAQIVDHPLLTSSASSITNPGFQAFIKGYFNQYSVNSLSKTAKFQMRHGYKILLPFYIVYFVMGTMYAAFFKYRKLQLKK